MAGRPKGARNNRALADIAAVAEKHPNWSPLLHCAEVANDSTLPPEVRLDAAKAALPYVHARAKPIEFDPSAAVELERHIAAAKADAVVRTVGPFDDLAERLDRAAARMSVTLEAAPREVSPATGLPRATARHVEPARPVDAAPLPACVDADWERPPTPAYAPILPEITDPFADYEEMPGSLLSCYREEN